MKHFKVQVKSFKLFSSDKANKELYDKWSELVNMTLSELKAFRKTDEGKAAGLPRNEAKKEGINSGQASADALEEMIPSGGSFKAASSNWSDEQWGWASDQVSFISRMSGNEGPIRDDKGNLTRKATSLMI